MQPWISCQVQCTVRSTTLNIPIPAVFASPASLLPRLSCVSLLLSLLLCLSRSSLLSSPASFFSDAYVVRAYTRVVMGSSRSNHLEYMTWKSWVFFQYCSKLDILTSLEGLEYFKNPEYIKNLENQDGHRHVTTHVICLYVSLYSFAYVY